MLYSEKPGTESPARWHRYWFLVKDAFFYDIPHQFSMDYTTLDPEDSEVTTVEFQMLVDGFRKALPLKTFCDPDVVIKVGLYKGANNFPSMTLDNLLLFKVDKALTPSQINSKVIVLEKSLMNKVLGSMEPMIASTVPTAKVHSVIEKSPTIDRATSSDVFLHLTAEKDDVPQFFFASWDV
ncbi:hypothetical protein LIER_28995 [Lithospermum erythrorhizon]|uniref:Uncharacterized protein n=1 Tax=Lithospermum erythrorhizon TaxID=34254 RepID=A0AAV3RLA7_LITER